MTTVTQEDREAAAKGMVLTEMRDLILAGRMDHHAEAFAAHREAAELRGARAMQEAATRHLAAVQYSPSPYTDMKHRLALLDPATIIKEVRSDG